MKKTFYHLLTGILLITACSNPQTSNNDHDTEATDKGNAYADSVNQGLKTDTLKGSPQRVTVITIGQTHMHLFYYAPGVKGRIIWGGLVPYNQVWVTGAHQCTRLELNEPILINNKKIPAGIYALFTIPGEKEWTFILNKNHEQHLADDYKQEEDVMRFTVTPASTNMVQRLTWKLNQTGTHTGSISMEWEKIKIEVPFTTTK